MNETRTQDQAQTQVAASPPVQAAPLDQDLPPANAPDREPASPRHHPVQTPLLSRYAESILWLARYMERIENIARILDVTRTFSRDGQDGRNWLAVLRINADEQRFRETYAGVTGQNVARFYLLDRNNPTSIVAAITQVRENARTLRALISTEMWLQINVFHEQLRGLGEDDIAPQHVSRTCAMLKEGVQSHTGITDGTFYHDQSWSFYSLGRHLERADQTTRLLDIRYAMMHAGRTGNDSSADVEQWHALLRASAGYHAYRRVYPRGYSAPDVAGFLLLDGGFPRSVSLNLSQIYWHLSQLRGRYGIYGGRAAMERLDDLRGLLAAVTAEDLIERGLPPFLDWMQQQFGLLHDDIKAGFFPD